MREPERRRHGQKGTVLQKQGVLSPLGAPVMFRHLEGQGTGSYLHLLKCTYIRSCQDRRSPLCSGGVSKVSHHSRMFSAVRHKLGSKRRLHFTCPVAQCTACERDNRRALVNRPPCAMETQHTQGSHAGSLPHWGCVVCRYKLGFINFPNSSEHLSHWVS